MRPSANVQHPPSADAAGPADVLIVSGVTKSFRRQAFLPWSRVNHVLKGASFAL
ncbi:MAG TPA: hypothetical protein VMR52_03155 [Dehalococcoidia bacterium]|nr:hypothetical protein [Dehalococcoidia bacterium]